MFSLFSLFFSATTGGAPALDTSGIIIAAVSVIGTFGASWLMFRGKTQDTANWLIVELRTEAKEARQSALECEVKRAEDRKILDELRGVIVGLQGGIRKLSQENKALKERLERLENSPPTT